MGCIEWRSFYRLSFYQWLVKGGCTSRALIEPGRKRTRRLSGEEFKTCATAVSGRRHSPRGSHTHNTGVSFFTLHGHADKCPIDQSRRKKELQLQAGGDDRYGDRRRGVNKGIWGSVRFYFKS